LIREELTSALEIVLVHEDLAPAAEGAASEDPGRRDIRVPVEALDALAAEETDQGLRLAFIGYYRQSHRLSHGVDSPSSPRNGLPGFIAR